MTETEDIRQRKRQARQRLAALRDSLSPKEKAKLDAAMAEHVLTLQSYIHADALLLYASFNNEPDTTLIVGRALSEGKRVAMPRCRDKGIGIDFYEIFSLDELFPGKYGIPEPLAQSFRLVDTADFSFCLVPSLALDAEGYRMGYGRGYYDRFLEGYRGVKAGLCYSFLIERRLPRGCFDKRVDIIVTEQGVRPVEKP